MDQETKNTTEDTDQESDLNDDSNNQPEQTGDMTNGYYRPDDNGVTYTIGIPKVAQKLFKKRKLVIFGAVGIAVLLVFLYLFYIMGTLALPNYAANIAARRLARTAMDYSRTAARIDAERLALDSADDSTYRQILNKYRHDKYPIWQKVGEKYRPKVMYENLAADGRITYKEKIDTKFGFTRYKIKSVVIDGKEISIKERWGHPWDNYRQRVKFAGEIQASVDKALQGYKSAIRSGVAKKIRIRLGIKLMFWDKKGSLYKKGMSEAELDLQTAKDRREKITQYPEERPVTDILDKSQEKYKKLVDDCYADPKCAARISRGDIPEDIVKALDDMVEPGMFMKAVGFAGTAYELISLLCMIYDGSLNNSGSDIDAQTIANVKSFYVLTSGADQRNKGDVTAEAVGSLNRVLIGKNDSGDSIPDQYMRGKSPDTSAEKSPESSIAGDYTLLNAVLGNNEYVNQIEDKVTPLCKALTTPEAAIIDAGISVAVMIFSGGSSEIGKGLTAGATKAAKKIVEKIFEKGFLKSISKKALTSSWGFSKKFARDFVAIEGLTAMAKMAVLSKAGIINDGATASGANFKNQADMGGDIHNNDMEREMFYGIPMKNKNIIKSDKAVSLYLKEQNGQLPAFQRYFAVSNPQSLLNKTFYHIRYFSKIKISSYIYKYLSAINFGSAMKIFTGEKFVLAADGSVNGHYDIVQWGWTEDELAIIDSDDSFGLLENAKRVVDEEEANGTISKIEQDYGKCFTETIGTLLSKGDIIRSENGEILDKGDCSPKNLGINNPKYGEWVFRWRLSKRDENMTNQMIEMQEPTKEEAASDSPDTAPGVCDPRTEDGGMQEGYNSGEPVKIKTCWIKDASGKKSTLQVNAEISKEVQDLIEAAKADNKDLLTNSTGFRTMSEQISLWDTNGCTPAKYDPNAQSHSCGGMVAWPGTSNHQMGRAIDFRYNNASICYKNETDACRASNAGFQWLKANASKYGLKNYHPEPWHWSTTGN